jgi:biopolymer transport protein ExbD
MLVHSPVASSNPIMELNTTPLIDVMLVLLVMFIITVPIQTHEIKLDLPTGPTSSSEIRPTQNLLEITADGSLLWNSQPVSRDRLKSDLQITQQMQPAPELHFRPDAHARYAVVADVLGIIKREHVRYLGFVGNEAYRNW